MRRMTSVLAMVARCRVYSIKVLTKDSAVTGPQLCQHSSSLHWQCLFDCSNRRLSAIKQFWWAVFNDSYDHILVDATDCRLVAGVAEWLFGEVLLDVRLKPVDQRSSSFRPVIWRSVAELIAGMFWQMTCYGDMLGNQLVMLAICREISSICRLTGRSRASCCSSVTSAILRQPVEILSA